MPLVINHESTRADLQLAIGYLREKRSRARDAEVIASIDADIDECLEAWAVAPA